MTGVREAWCNGDAINPRQKAALMEAAQYYDYLAWLFNAEHVSMQSARRYWAPSMLETYELAALQQISIAQKRLIELREFKFATPKSERPTPESIAAGC